MPASTEASCFGDYSSAPVVPVVKTLYLVRHGEATHNIEEQIAKRRAAAEAQSQGHLEGSEAYKAMVEAARKASLRDERLRDAKLSTTGREQTATAKDEFKALTESGVGLPEPAVVLVSPLERTVETAEIMFAEHPRVCLCEALLERRTGLPCDEPRMEKPRLELTDLPNYDSSIEAGVKQEDAKQLRARTGRLVQALMSVEDSVICLVTHKGLLRELERGPLGQPDAKEFLNCEVRAYDVILLPDGRVVAEQLHSAEAPWQGRSEGLRRGTSGDEVAAWLDLRPVPTLEEVYSVC